MHKWRKNGVKAILVTPETLENKGDVKIYETRNSGASQRGKVHSF